MNGLVPVSCRTNLDDYRGETWPKYMYNPQVGQWVESKSGKILKIVSITHKQTFSQQWGGSVGDNKDVYLSVELHRIV